jgi:RNA polymerase sigma-70 factor (ECF subfamily)
VVLYQRHREPIFRFAYRMLGSAEAAEDVTHDCFLALMTQPLRFDPSRASLRTYLCGAARNLSLKHLRAEGRELRGDPVPEPVIDGPALHGLLDHEMACQVREAVSALPPLQREVVVLVEYEGVSIAQAAEVVGAEVGTVKARLHRARESLRLRLASLRAVPALSRTGDEE